MNNGRIEVTDIINYKRIKKQIKSAKHLGIVDKTGAKEIYSIRPKGKVLINYKMLRIKNFSFMRQIRLELIFGELKEILIFDTRFEALQWLAKSDSIFVKMQEPDDQLPDTGKMIPEEPENSTTKEPENSPALSMVGNPHSKSAI